MENCYHLRWNGLSLLVGFFRIKSLIWPNVFNRIYVYGQIVYLWSILEDIEAIKRTRSFANINKRVYEYKASNTFEIGDEVIILDESSKANTMVPPESSSLGS